MEITVYFRKTLFFPSSDVFIDISFFFPSGFAGSGTWEIRVHLNPMQPPPLTVVFLLALACATIGKNKVTWRV